MSAKYAFAKPLKELRFHFCQTGESGVGLRSFLQKAYPAMKQSNPSTPILIREATGVNPVVYARFALGKETAVPLVGLTEKQIETEVEKLVKSN
ncbi:NADH-ubiquinone oxidoreductase [Dipodascopsis tothii]|uniref:NADH-ubiquinone oxidoreductase n=1 Tax=Dipodascopsis tothii TaxID=44089 RepID=UPI0034CE93A0